MHTCIKVQSIWYLNLFLKVKSCDVYVYVYNLKFYNEIFKINIINWCNIFTFQILAIIIFIEVWNQKYG